MTMISGDPTTQLAFSMSENLGVYAVSVAEVSRAEMKERLKTGNFHYLVSGRIKWNEQSRKRIATGLSLEEYGAPLFRAGFAQGDKEYLDTFIEGLQHHMG